MFFQGKNSYLGSIDDLAVMTSCDIKSHFQSMKPITPARQKRKSFISQLSFFLSSVTTNWNSKNIVWTGHIYCTFTLQRAISRYIKEHKSWMEKGRVVNMELDLHFVISNNIFEKYWLNVSKLLHQKSPVNTYVVFL